MKLTRGADAGFQAYWTCHSHTGVGLVYIYLSFWAERFWKSLRPMLPSKNTYRAKGLAGESQLFPLMLSQGGISDIHDAFGHNFTFRLANKKVPLMFV